MVRTFQSGTTYYGGAFDQQVEYKVIKYTPKPEGNGGAILIESDGKQYYLSAVNYDMAVVGHSPDRSRIRTHETIVLSVKADAPQWRETPLLHLAGIDDLHSVAVMFLAHQKVAQDSQRRIADYLTSVANEDPDKTAAEMLAELERD